VLRIADLIAYRKHELCKVTCAGEARLPLAPGAFRAIGFVDGAGREHIALVMGSLDADSVPLVSIHAESPFGDIFGMGRDGLQHSLSRIAEQGNGILIYLREAKTTAVLPSTCERSLSQHDERVAHEILANLGVRHFRRLQFDRCDPHIQRSA
jgi:3,4-dihydroxy 2-butanone 4-phosphate synthase/GTP cyclohydrolase II